MKPIAGKLVTPDDNPIPNASVRFISLNNTLDGALKGTMFAFDTDPAGVTAGNYNTSVLPGSYKVEFKHPSRTKYITLGNVTLPIYAEELADNRIVTDDFTIISTLTTVNTIVTTSIIGTCAMVVGTVYTIISVGDTDFSNFGCSTCTNAVGDVGEVFTYAVGAAGAASGSGTVSYNVTTTENVVTTDNHYVTVTITGGTPNYAVTSLTGTLTVPAVVSPIIALTFDKVSAVGQYGTFALDTGNVTPDGKWTYTPYVNSTLPLEDIGIS